jgi:hypothetical protein
MTDSGTAGRLIARVRARGPLWLGAHAALYAWDKAFDFGLYPLAQLQLGVIAGTGAMMVASLAVCVMLLLLYDRLATAGFRDLLGFESLKEIGAGVRHSMLAQRMAIATGRPARIASAALLFFYLSIWFDPMTCMIFMRPADHHRMSLQYWALFGASVFVSNAAWATLVYAGVETAQDLLGVLAVWSSQP